MTLIDIEVADDEPARTTADPDESLHDIQLFMLMKTFSSATRCEQSRLAAERCARCANGAKRSAAASFNSQITCHSFGSSFDSREQIGD